MCGICGKIYRDPTRVIAPSLIEAMRDALAHRGPDEYGSYVHDNVGLGHRRLSIIDLTTGQQPMSNQRGDLWIVYNGEMYNFPGQRKALEADGYEFRTNSDTEVILALYDKYGVECVRYIRGMFALAIWDAHRRRLFLARDRVGQKPLFYRLTDEALAFGSEIKALLTDPEYQPEMNLTAMHHYLTYQYVPPPDTMFAGIRKLPPAHTLIWEDGKLTIEPYWDLNYTPKHTLPLPELQRQLQDILQEAVNIRMISDVPIGAFLSGGIDSSLVVALMAQHSSQPVKTYSIGFREKAYNELPYARMVAERYRTEHHEFIVEPDAVEVLPKLIHHFDEPFADSSAIPTYYVSQLTGQHVKVALNGDGGDESFAGYLRYLGHTFVRRYRCIPTPLRRYLAAPIINALHALPALRRRFPRTLRRIKYFNALSLESREELYARTLIMFDNALKLELLTPELRRQFESLNSLDYMFQYFQSDRLRHSTDRMLYSDVMTYLPGDLLVKMDRMTMAHSLEGRSPFLDHLLMEWTARVPGDYKLRGTCLKYLLKQTARPWLPAEILTRKKQGFGVPLEQWFRNELRDMLHDVFGSSRLARDGILDHAVMLRLMQEHQRGIANHYHRLWVLLNLELWYRAFLCHD